MSPPKKGPFQKEISCSKPLGFSGDTLVFKGINREMQRQHGFSMALLEDALLEVTPVTILILLWILWELF